MGKTPGRPKRGQLADMTSQPPPDPGYLLPNPDDCEDHTWPVGLAPYNELRARYMLWRERLIVDFAITQITLAEDGWRDVARVDCAHGVIHRHQFQHDSAQTVARIEYAKIPVDDSGWAFVDSWYYQALKMMQDDWQEALRRWNGDSR